MTKLVHASINELGQITGGLPGDQTGKEVLKQDFFEFGWEYIFRPKSAKIAEKIAYYAEIIAANDHIGYGQNDRYTMYLIAKAMNWNFEAITTNCSCDCSQLVATILIACGIMVSPYMYTGNEKGALINTGEFVMLKYEKGMRLLSGDIALTTTKGHTAIIVEGTFPSAIPKWVAECYGTDSAPVYDEPSESSARCVWPTLGTGNLFDVCDSTATWLYIRIAGEYFGWIQSQYALRKTFRNHGRVESDVYVRVNAGANFKAIGILSTGEVVSICDEKLAANGDVWYYILYKDGWGFCSSKYIVEI